jgi:hypothetical protein
MTEAQLRAFPRFKTLPVFDESDVRSDSLTTVQGAGNQYRAIRECSTLQEVENCLNDPRLVPLGGLRAVSSGQVVAYFGERL